MVWGIQGRQALKEYPVIADTLDHKVLDLLAKSARQVFKALGDSTV